MRYFETVFNWGNFRTVFKWSMCGGAAYVTVTSAFKWHYNQIEKVKQEYDKRIKEALQDSKDLEAARQSQRTDIALRTEEKDFAESKQQILHARLLEELKQQVALLQQRDGQRELQDAATQRTLENLSRTVESQGAIIRTLELRLPRNNEPRIESGERTHESSAASDVENTSMFPSLPPPRSSNAPPTAGAFQNRIYFIE